MNTMLDLLKRVGNAILMVLVTPIMLANEFRKALSDTVYHGFEGGLRACFGVLLGLGGAGALGHYLGWTLNWHTSAWVSAGVASWFAIYWFAWPLLYLGAVKPAFQIAQLGWDVFQGVSKKYADKVFGGLVRGLSKCLPGSAGAWDKVLGDKKDSWVSKLVVGLAYPVTLIGSFMLGLQVFHGVAGGFSSEIFGVTLGVVAGIIAGGTVLGAIWQFIDHGKLPFVVVALAVGLDRVFSNEISGASSLLHLNGYYSIITHVLAGVVFLGYVFPIAHLLLSGGFIKWLVQQLKPLNEKAYDDKDKVFTEFFHNAFNLLLTGTALYQAYTWAAVIALPVYALVPALLAVALFVYFWTFDVLDHGGGTFFTGLGTSVYAGWKVYGLYMALGLAGHAWMAVPVALLSALVVGVVLFPAAYVYVFKPVCNKLGISKLGAPLTKAHKYLEAKAQKVANLLSQAYTSSYRDKTSYQVWFLHAANLVFTGVLAYTLPSVLSFASQHVPAFVASVLTAAWLNGPVAVVCVAALSYILVGRFLQKSNVGTEFVGGISSLALAVWATAVTDAAAVSNISAVIVGVTAWLAGYLLFFPAAYIGLRYPAKPLLASWSTAILVAVHEFSWNLFSVVWTQFERVYKVLDNALFVPLRKAVSAASNRVSAAYNWVRDRILSRKR